MKHVAKLLFPFIFLAVVLNSCYEAEVFSDIPEIEFQAIEYVDTDAQDSLILRFSFKDENADIGLSADQIFEPFNTSFGVGDTNGEIVTLLGDFEPPYFLVPISILPFEYFLKDSLDQNNQQRFRVESPNVYTIVGSSILLGSDDPRPDDPTCNDFVVANFYDIVEVNSIYEELVKTPEEILIIENELHYNFHIDFFRKSGGNFSFIDFEEIFNACTDTFDGRIPVFDPNGKEGFITYAMLSRGFRLAFLDDTVRAEFYIYDRSGNKSNVEVTPDFVLKDLL